MPNGTTQFKTTTPEVIEPNAQTANQINPVDLVESPEMRATLAKPRTIISPKPAVAKVNEIKTRNDEIQAGIEEQARLVEERKAQPQVSVVDYLASKEQPNDFASREKLAEQYGISDYRGTAQQNTQLLSALREAPPTPEQTPEERAREEMKGAIRGAFAPEDYEQNPYLKRPDESVDEYNIRVEALRKSGIPETTEEDEEPETPQDTLSTQINESNDRIDKAYKSYQDQMNQLMTGTFPLTQAEQQQLNLINQTFDRIKAAQITANKNYEKAIEISGIAAGRQRYAPEVEAGNIKKAVDQGIAKLADIETNRFNALTELQSAIQDKNYAMINSSYEKYREYEKDKMNAMKDIYTIAKDAQDRADKIVAEQLKMIEDENKRIETEKNKIMSSAAKTGAPADVIAAIGEAETVADAVNAAGKYLETGTGIVGEYLYYKKEQERQGLPVIDFNTYQTIDANRKAKAQSLISGLDPRVASQVDALSKGYDSSPIVKQFNDVLNKKISINSIIDSSSGGPADLALVFEFMKSLDPTSVVRESEYDTASKAGNPMKRIAAKIGGYFSDGKFLPEEVKEEFKNITGLKFDAIKRQYDNIRKETARKINMKTGGIDGADYLTDYDISVADIAENWADKVDDFIIANPDVAEIAKQLYIDGKSEEDVYNYLITNQ